LKNKDYKKFKHLQRKQLIESDLKNGIDIGDEEGEGTDFLRSEGADLSEDGRSVLDEIQSEIGQLESHLAQESGGYPAFGPSP
jgi:hypothetical protein